MTASRAGPWLLAVAGCAGLCAGLYSGPGAYPLLVRLWLGGSGALSVAVALWDGWRLR